MTGKQVSRQQVAVIEVFLRDRKRSCWFGAHSVERQTGLSGNTVRALLLGFRRLGLLECRELFGGYRYQLKLKSALGQDAKSYLQRIEEAIEALREPRQHVRQRQLTQIQRDTIVVS